MRQPQATSLPTLPAPGACGDLLIPSVLSILDSTDGRAGRRRPAHLKWNPAAHPQVSVPDDSRPGHQTEVAAAARRAR